MGSELVTDSSPVGGEVQRDLAPTSYTEMFYKQLPFYLSIGMTWAEFWEDDAAKAKYYREAYYLKRDRENQELWMQGAYIYNALCCVAPVLHAFSKKGTKPLPYLAEPFALTNKQVKDKKEEREQKAYDTAKDKMFAYAGRFNKAREKLKKEVEQHE